MVKRMFVKFPDTSPALRLAAGAPAPARHGSLGRGGRRGGESSGGGIRGGEPRFIFKRRGESGTGASGKVAGGTGIPVCRGAAPTGKSGVNISPIWNSANGPNDIELDGADAGTAANSETAVASTW